MLQLYKYNTLEKTFFLILPLVFLISSASCYPMLESVTKPDNLEEKTFPNGTVMGKYAYVDSEGNPIKVKYYADDQSYGVELSSVKVVHTGAPAPEKETEAENIKPDTVADGFKYPNNKKMKLKTNPLDFQAKKSDKSHLKNKYANPDYESYLQNDLTAPQCNADIEKVKIYNYNGDKRNLLKAIIDEEEQEDEQEDTKFCKRF